MSCGRGEGKSTMWKRYEKLLLKEYYYQQKMQEERRRKALDLKRFGLAAKAHAKICGEIPADMLRLKKPILPKRWRGPREGWSQWSELLINPGITIKGLPDLQSEPLTAKMIYDAIQKLGENWRPK